VGWILMEIKLWGLELDVTGSGSCRTAECGISDVEPLCSTTTVSFRLHLRLIYRSFYIPALSGCISHWK
jgi:hypothetical protein